MLRSVCFWCIWMIASQCFGQERQPLKETKVLGGTIVETFVPDPPKGPVPDPAFQAPQSHAVIPTPIYEQPQPQSYQHPPGCRCAAPACRARLLNQFQHQRTFIEQKLLEKRTTVTVRVTETEQQLPAWVIESYPQPQRQRPQQNPCCPPYGNRPAFQRQGGYGGYAYWQRPQGIFSALFGFNSGISVRTTGGNQGYRGYGAYGGGYPPYAQSGQNYGGSKPWYGGRQS